MRAQTPKCKRPNPCNPSSYPHFRCEAPTPERKGNPATSKRAGREASPGYSLFLPEALSCTHVRATPTRSRRTAREASGKHRQKVRETKTQNATGQNATGKPRNHKAQDGSGRERPEGGPTENRKREARPQPGVRAETTETREGPNRKAAKAQTGERPKAERGERPAAKAQRAKTAGHENGQNRRKAEGRAERADKSGSLARTVGEEATPNLWCRFPPPPVRVLSPYFS